MTFFTGEKVRLAAIQREDIPIYVAWFQDYEVQRNLNFVTPMTLEAETEWFDARAKESDSEKLFGIRTIEDDKLIGNTTLFGINTRSRSAIFGIVIGDKDYWGRGYGSDRRV